MTTPRRARLMFADGLGQIIEPVSKAWFVGFHPPYVFPKWIDKPKWLPNGDYVMVKLQRVSVTEDEVLYEERERPADELEPETTRMNDIVRDLVRRPWRR